MSDYELTSAEIKKLSDIRELMQREWSPCRYACPAHADVRTYIELAAQGRFKESIDVVREHLPFAAVCGRVCHHPCEDNCRRNDVDDPVAIREVKRFVAEKVGTDATVHKAKKQDKQKVAVIGAGPAGMSCALELAKKGYQPTIFEKFPIGGGVPATTIPKYRLPHDVVQIDVKWILAHGIDLKTGIEIGKDKTIDELLKEGFSAIIIAAGLAKSKLLPLPGADNPRVLAVMDFLTDLAFDRKVDIGSNVLVIGGGNVACDAARSAVRLGAEKVTMTCLESPEEMPAFSWEIRESEEEGVEIVNRRGPVEIVTENGKITGLKARKATRVFDENKRFSPQYDDSDIITLDCDTVIFAIGQTGDYLFAQGSNLNRTERGLLEFDLNTHQTNLPNVFACGEIVTPPGSVVEACANGRRAASAVDMYLQGQAIKIDDSIPPAIDKIEKETADKLFHVDRVKVPTDKAAERIKNFEEFEHNLNTETAACEARRCMNCGGGAEVIVDKCIACLTCLRVCPFDIPKVTDVADIKSILCQACGICIAECPANAIVAKSWDKDELAEKSKEAAGKTCTIAYICGHNANTKELVEGEVIPSVTQFLLPSLARLRVMDLLSPFENGAENVIILEYTNELERYPKAALRARKRFNQARQILADIGIDKDKLKWVELSEKNASIKEALAKALEEAKTIKT